MRAICYRESIRLALALALLSLAACGPAPEKRQEAPRKQAARTMPDVYKVRFATNKGPFVVEVHKDWAPRGAERFWRLVDLGFFDKSRIFRVKRHFVVQFGVSSDPHTNGVFNSLPIKDDPVKQSNKRGMMSFATNGPGTRRTQVFINLRDNTELDKQGFAPFARVIDGMDAALELFYSGYGEMPPRGTGPDPSKLAVEGDSYAESKFPLLDKIFKASVVD
jgi:peptidyl-prolyl cis-trans isomerase A (cyclophilin A)